jgi:hypothetical protein
MAVVFEDHSTEVLRRMRGNLKQAAIDCGDIARDAVQMKILYGYSDLHGNPPHTEIVDTGALFDSIKGEVVAVNANVYQTVVSTDRPYAGYVHNGTYKLKGRPFITDGILDSREEIKNAVKAALKSGITDK